MYLHWSWFLAAAYMINRGSQYSSYTWSALLYLALFLIVLMHEFGHSLACRQVGGQAEQIVLWPLGGVAYVNPPQRPGATLWSIAAGPLVNVVLIPILANAVYYSGKLGWDPALDRFLLDLWWMNLLLLLNLLPIYPLDGGQILRSLLWFAVGPAQSLMIATSIGFVGVGVLLVAALFWWHSIWYIAIAAFLFLNCWGGLRYARMLAKATEAPRHEAFACPNCHTSPSQGPFWMCGQCRKTFDTFAHNATCPNCGAHFSLTRCMECGENFPLYEWVRPISSEPPPVLPIATIPPPLRPNA